MSTITMKVILIRSKGHSLNLSCLETGCCAHVQTVILQGSSGVQLLIKNESVARKRVTRVSCSGNITNLILSTLVSEH